MTDDSGISENALYQMLRKEPLPKEVLKEVFQQYYCIRTFPQILVGPAARVDDEFIRLKSARTVVSELGDGHGEAIHRFGNRKALRDDTAANQSLSQEQHAQLPGARHRLFETHPVTGAPGLFAPSGSAMSVVGLSDAQSHLALDALEEFVLKELPAYTHRYQPGDLVIWDNMSTLHRGTGVSATRDFETSRLLHRINVQYAGARAGAPERSRSAAGRRRA
ncbi:TauD/TfdA family dioxygenase [Streptomyces sp. ITFR-16]|uniref:TauD/TfdA family dioxygenase n=1 Tax=Streptomyces sp. ITFR-16 TaxID=3075198 RepID=UPI0028893571|nr:TauD/TfdA family dioxygenase [Streptomyces sp. ITFR-16]WNI26147.1 TauD/TfdA family dioxygenase [Streptomyces sp. ITFR-16]